MLGFEVLSGRHTGEYLATKVVDIIDELEFGEKLGYVTADSAGNNGTLTRSLENLLAERFIRWNSAEYTIHCIAHVINLCVTSFIDSFAEDSTKTTFHDVIDAWRNIAKVIRSSHLTWEAFSQCCESLKIRPITIPLDVPTRWNSLFDMLARCLYLRKPIRRFIQEHAPHLRITDTWWEYTEVLCAFLMPFYRCTKRFENKSSLPEIDYVFFAYNAMYDHIDDVKEAIQKKQGIGSYRIAASMAPALDRMEATLQKYYKLTALPPVYGDAMILNPRCKLSIFNDSTWSEADGEKYAADCRYRFLQHYTTPNHQPKVSESNQQAALHHEDSEFAQILQQRASKHHRNDFDRYIEIPNDVHISSSLEWWKKNKSLYPDLAKMARDVLAVPASSSSVERMFSISGKIATWQRNRLNPRTIRNLMVYKGRLLFEKQGISTGSVLSKVINDDDLPVQESEEGIPPEWANQWWIENVEGKNQDVISERVKAMFGSVDG